MKKGIFLGCALLAFLFPNIESKAMEVGRATLELPGDQWQLVTTYETQLRITGFDGEHFIPMENRLFQEYRLVQIRLLDAQHLRFTKWNSRARSPGDSKHLYRSS